MNINEIKKDLYKSKAVAKFSHYDGDTGQLVYLVDLLGTPHQFPLNVSETNTGLVPLAVQYDDGVTVTKPTIIDMGLKLADDLKGAKFAAEVKGSDLNRWITKAFEKGELVMLAPNPILN